MKKIVILLATLLISTGAFAVEAPKTDEQKTLYTIGNSIARSLAVFNLTKEEFEYVILGLHEAQNGKQPGFDGATYTAKIQELARARRKATGDKLAVAGVAFLEKAASAKGAQKLPSGMVYHPLVEGKGDSPKVTDVVKVNYRGTLIDGKEFDSSYKRAKPLEFKLENVIKCWQEGLQKMKPGGKAKLVCPSNLAYGENGAGEAILPGATLQFEVELLDYTPSKETPKPAVSKPGTPAETPKSAVTPAK